MVELRKRPAPPPPPPPAKKKAPAKPKAKKDEPKTVEAQEAEAAPQATEPVAASSKGGSPQVGETVTLEGFGGEVETNDGEKATLAKLVSASKAGVVLFTYPKASTPGCTKQARLFRESYEPLTATGLSIFGLSRDSPKANTSWKTKEELPYPLLSDPSGTIIGAIGFHKAPKNTMRGVFVVDKNGKVLAAEAGGPDATVNAVKKLVATMAGSSEVKGVEQAEEKVAAADKKAAETANEVADSAARVDS